MITKPNRRGFTLLELLVVILIIAVLAALSMLAVSRIRSSANQAVTVANMRQIGVGLISYTSDNGSFPSVSDPTWDRAILPNLGYTDPLPGARKSVIKPSEAPAVQSVANIFASPSDTSGEFDDAYRRSFAIIPWTTNLKVGNSFRGWPDLPFDQGVRYSMLDSPEKSAMVVQWHSDGKTVENKLGNGGHQHHDMGGPVDSLHSRQQLVLFADGHIKGVPANMANKDFRDKYWPGTIGNIK